MKNIFKFSVIAAAALTLSSCNDFGDMNVDPEHLSAGTMNTALIFTNAQHQALGSDWDAWRNGMIYMSGYNQHVAAGGWWWSYPLNSFSNDYASSYWGSVLSGGDRGSIRDLQVCLDEWKDDGTNPNKDNYNIARIVRVYIMQRVSDMHGDIPYSEAGQPALYAYPKYDKQQDIYEDMLNVLQDAYATLGSGTASLGKQDIWYNGDIAKWKKFANSLMLRVAMRLSKVDPAKAKEWAARAYSNGVITDNADDCYLIHGGAVFTNDSCEPYAKIISHEDQDVPYIHETFYNILKGYNDPRIPLIMAIYPEEDARNGSEMKKDYMASAAMVSNCAPELQKGLPGFMSMNNKANSKWSIQFFYPEYTDEILTQPSSANYYKWTHSRPNHFTYGDAEAPTWVVTAAQTNLLLAEAAYRGWIGGNAEQFYNDGVRCAMKQFNTYPSSGAKTLCGTYLTDEAIAKYLEGPAKYDASKALELINTQYYITCFCDEYETFANLRRSAYPQIDTTTPFARWNDGGEGHNVWSQIGNFPKDGNFSAYKDGFCRAWIRRYPYPASERGINSKNYDEAIVRLGLPSGSTESDFNDTRVWWDTDVDPR